LGNVSRETFSGDQLTSLDFGWSSRASHSKMLGSFTCENSPKKVSKNYFLADASRFPLLGVYTSRAIPSKKIAGI
jgi:hypothetical protein